jgi:hypothetical protein
MRMLFELRAKVKKLRTAYVPVRCQSMTAYDQVFNVVRVEGE